MANAGMEFLRLLAIGMELDEHEFDERFRPKSVSTLRIMHYPTYQPKSASTLSDTCEEQIDTRPGSLAVNITWPEVTGRSECVCRWLSLDLSVSEM